MMCVDDVSRKKEAQSCHGRDKSAFQLHWWGSGGRYEGAVISESDFQSYLGEKAAPSVSARTMMTALEGSWAAAYIKTALPEVPQVKTQCALKVKFHNSS